MIYANTKQHACNYQAKLSSGQIIFSPFGKKYFRVTFFLFWKSGSMFSFWSCLNYSWKDRPRHLPTILRNRQATIQDTDCGWGQLNRSHGMNLNVTGGFLGKLSILRSKKPVSPTLYFLFPDSTGVSNHRSMYMWLNRTTGNSAMTLWWPWPLSWLLLQSWVTYLTHHGVLVASYQNIKVVIIISRQRLSKYCSKFLWPNETKVYSKDMLSSSQTLQQT